VDIVVTVGDRAHAAGGVGVPDTEAATAWLVDHLRPDDTVLVKASRGARLDTIVRSLLGDRRE
jgi:UDP-N-acetylmuramoyl-tripeptide--D-alanyl-D-alanine ligase